MEDDEQSQSQTTLNNVEIDGEEELNEGSAKWDPHGTKSKREAKTGKHKGRVVAHFHCKYCKKIFQGPSSTSFLTHLRLKHPKECPELLAKNDSAKPVRGFFDKRKMKRTFDVDVFMGKLLKWIVKTDKPFLEVDNEHFVDMMEYGNSKR